MDVSEKATGVEPRRRKVERRFAGVRPDVVAMSNRQVSRVAVDDERRLEVGGMEKGKKAAKHSTLG